MVTSGETWTKGNAMGTGTISDADWACQGNENNVFFVFNKRGGATGLGTSREVLGKGISWPQARLQMQIGHARATRIIISFFR